MIFNFNYRTNKFSCNGKQRTRSAHLSCSFLREYVRSVCVLYVSHGYDWEKVVYNYTETGMLKK